MSTPSVLTEYGPQYEDDDAFKAAARLHQSRFRAEQLGIPGYRGYGNRLPPEAALAGRNFYPWPGLLAAVGKRFKAGDKKLYWDMLGSDHIPFNFFIPLRDIPFTPALVAAWTGDAVERICGIEVEWKPKGGRQDHLGDQTSFDVFITYSRGGSGPDLGALAVEVKYTEREYGWNKTEKARMFDAGSAYHRVHRASGIYQEGALATLATRRLKQFWRNQLLGEAMLQRSAVTRFTSMLLYPAGNQHFTHAAAEYQALLEPAHRQRFVAVTYEAFICMARSLCSNDDVAAWLDYLDRRYIVPVAS